MGCVALCAAYLGPKWSVGVRGGCLIGDSPPANGQRFCSANSRQQIPDSRHHTTQPPAPALVLAATPTPLSHRKPPNLSKKPSSQLVLVLLKIHPSPMRHHSYQITHPIWAPSVIMTSGQLSIIAPAEVANHQGSQLLLKRMGKFVLETSLERLWGLFLLSSKWSLLAG